MKISERTKSLFIKEFNLSVSGFSFIFTVMGAVFLFIPLSSFGLFYSVMPLIMLFQQGKFNGEGAFNAILPLSKKETVLSKFYGVFFLELLFAAIAVPIAVITRYSVSFYEYIPAIRLNFTFFGLALITFGLFNISMPPLFIKGKHKSAGALMLALVIGFMIAATVLILAVPVLYSALAGYTASGLMYRVLFFIASILIFAGLTFWSYKLSLKNAGKSGT